MAYSEFTLNKTLNDFGLTLDQTTLLFDDTPPLAVSEQLKSIMAEYAPLALAINTEMARSAMILTPIVIELRRLAHQQISLFSGIDFKVQPEQGLSGFCDYIISHSPIQYFLNAPLLMLVEAKKEDVIAGLGQCAAEMVAAQIYNERQGRAIPSIYGVVTSGSVWRFLRLQEKTLVVEPKEYALEPVGRILGLLLDIVNRAEKEKMNGTNAD